MLPFDTDTVLPLICTFKHVTYIGTHIGTYVCVPKLAHFHGFTLHICTFVCSCTLPHLQVHTYIYVRLHTPTHSCRRPERSLSATLSVACLASIRFSTSFFCLRANLDAPKTKHLMTSFALQRKFTLRIFYSFKLCPGNEHSLVLESV